MGDAVQEIQRAVQRIDDPAVGLSVPSRRPPSSPRKLYRPREFKFLAQGLLGSVVGRGHEIRGSFHRHLEMLDLAEVPLERAAAFCAALIMTLRRAERSITR